jgi:hypothetical protein
LLENAARYRFSDRMKELEAVVGLRDDGDLEMVTGTLLSCWCPRARWSVAVLREALAGGHRPPNISHEDFFTSIAL